MSSKPILIILTPGFPASEQDNTCLPERQAFVRSLKDCYADLRVIVLSFHYPHSDRRYMWHGVEVRCFNGRNRSRMNRLILWWSVWREIRSIRAKNGQVIGVMSFWMGECSFVGNLVARRCQCKFYSWILGQDARPGNRYVRLMKPKSHQLIALSHFLQSEFEKNYGIRPAHVIVAGICPDLFPGDFLARDIDILGVGSLIPLKRFDLFIDAVRSLKTIHTHIRTVICGKGPEEKRLRELIKKYKLSENVVLAGELSHREVLTFMKRARVLLHTSAYEGLGYACLEGLYAGCEVISFRKVINENISKWHIVQSKEEMTEVLHQTLSVDGDFDPVMPYSMDNMIAETMSLLLPVSHVEPRVQTLPSFVDFPA